MNNYNLRKKTSYFGKRESPAYIRKVVVTNYGVRRHSIKNVACLTPPMLSEMA